ncbi:hypothetical protein [Nitrosococcus oceani]|uniref:hypothetical protein n=1 Tax=Nitrosococcus oceani TaxID=1229 RepID=UPI0034D2B645
MKIACSKVKYFLRKVQARTKESLYLALVQILNPLIPEHAKVYFGHVRIRV